MKLLAVGPLWRGSNAGGLFRAMSRQGCLMEIMDEFYYISLQTKTKSTKILERLLRPRQTKEFNAAICKRIDLFQPDIIFVYKGTFVMPETLEYAKKKGCRLVLFYPDVSTTAHGPHIPKAIPHYELIFTTKTFGITDMASKYGVTNSQFMPHGFDPEIHRPLELTAVDKQNFCCDASFIGTWSPKKEALLSALKLALPDIDLRIWGEQWFKATNEAIKGCIQHTAILGDLYALAIQASRINLGILSEQVAGASSGDLITSRTFHIPGASGFMLHERNEESLQYFKEGSEAAFFGSEQEMITQVKHYLNDDSLREKVRQAGHQRALRDHSLDARARTVMELMTNRLPKTK